MEVNVHPPATVALLIGNIQTKFHALCKILFGHFECCGVYKTTQGYVFTLAERARKELLTFCEACVQEKRRPHIGITDSFKMNLEIVLYQGHNFQLH